MRRVSFENKMEMSLIPKPAAEEMRDVISRVKLLTLCGKDPMIVNSVVSCKDEFPQTLLVK